MRDYRSYHEVTDTVEASLRALETQPGAAAMRIRDCVEKLDRINRAAAQTIKRAAAHAAEEEKSIALRSSIQSNKLSIVRRAQELESIEASLAAALSDTRTNLRQIREEQEAPAIPLDMFMVVEDKMRFAAAAPVHWNRALGQLQPPFVHPHPMEAHIRAGRLFNSSSA
eukprot:g179.t1